MNSMAMENVIPGMLVTVLPSRKNTKANPYASHPLAMQMLSASKEESADDLAGDVFRVQAVCEPFAVLLAHNGDRFPVNMQDVALMEVTEEYRRELYPPGQQTAPAAHSTDEDADEQSRNNASVNFTTYRSRRVLGPELQDKLKQYRKKRDQQVAALFEAAEPGQYVAEWFLSACDAAQAGVRGEKGMEYRAAIVDTTSQAQEIARANNTRVWVCGPKPSPQEERYG